MNQLATTIACFLALLSAAWAGAPKIVVLSTFGTTNSGTISLPGQEDRFTFSGTIGQQLYYDALDLDFESINARLIAPSGTTLWEVNHSSDSGPFYLTQSGTYTLVLDGTGDATGDYSFRLLNLASATAISYGTTISGQLAPQSAAAAFRFNGTNGQRISVQSIAASSANSNWRVVSPAGDTLLGSGNISGDLGEAVLSDTGSYLVLVEGNSGDIGTLDFQFRVSLLSNASGGTSGFGVVRSGSLLMGQSNSFTYTGPAGLPIYLDVLTNYDPVTVQLVSPSNEMVFSAGNSDGGPYILPRSGTYTLNVLADNGTDATYKFRLLDLNASAIPLTNATPYFRTPGPFEAEVFRFSSSAGQQFYFDSLDNVGASITPFLYQPNRQSLTLPDTAFDYGPFTLLAPGTNYLVLSSANSDPGHYGFRVMDMSQPPVSVVPFDTLVSGTNAFGNGVTAYRFTGVAGQRLFFDAASTNSSGNWNVYSPDGNALGGSSLNGDFEVVLTQTGTHLLIAGNNTVTNATSFTFRIITPNSTTNTLSLGTVVNGSLVEPGESDVYTFTGTVGQRLYYDALQFDSEPFNATLLSPSGNTLPINGNADSDAGPFALTEAGTYTLILHAPSELTGTYSFRLLDVSQPPAQAVALNTTVNGTNSPAVGASIYRFTGTAGQRLFFDFDETYTNAFGAWSLYDPNNNYVFYSVGLTSDAEVTLLKSGTYLLVAGNYGSSDLAAFSFRIITPATTTSALTLGATVNGTLSGPGDSARFTFTGNAGQRLWYDGLQNDFQNLTVQLFDPAGNLFGALNGNSDSDFGLFVLPQSGLYTLELHAPSEVTGSYQFRLLDLASAPAITYGNLLTGQLNPQLQTTLYRINGTAGQRLLITNLLASSSDANLFLIAPDNANIVALNVASDFGELFLPVTGTYALVIQGTSGNIGTYDYQFRVNLIGSASGSPSGLSMEQSGTTTLDQTNSFTFSAPAGQPIYFDALTNVSPATVRLLDPAGQYVFQVSANSDAGPYFLPRNGAYTLEVVGTGDGNYHFRILDLATDATNLAYGTTYSQTLTPAFRTDLFRFTVTNGQTLYLDSLKLYPLYQESLTLYTPRGTPFFGGYGWSDGGPFLLSEPGTYYFAVASNDTDDTLDYSFRIISAAQSPASAVALDTPVSGTLTPGLGAAVYRLSGIAGQRLFFNAASTNGGGYWNLYSPNGTALGGSSMNGDFEVVLTQTGTHLLIAGNNGSLDPLPYAFQIVTPNTTTNALVLGAATSGSLAEPGEEDWFSFAGTAGQRLYYDALDNDGDNQTVTVYDPNGNVIVSIGAEQDADPFTLSYSGTYLLRVKDNADSTGNYAFRLLDAASATPVPYDTVINDSVTNAFGTRLYSIPATAGLRLIVDGLGTQDVQGNMRLYTRNNTFVGNAAFGQDLEVTPPNADPYLLVMRSSVSTNLPYSFQVVPGNHAPVLASIGPFSINESNTLSFTVSANDAEAPNDQLTFSLDPGAPAGATLNPITGAFSWMPVETQGPGVYPVTVRVTDDGIPNLSSSLTFNIAVHEVNVAPVLTVPTNQTINELTVLNVSASATDPDIPANPLFFSLISPPAGMTINTNTGAISWTPTEAQGPSTNLIQVVVTDLNTNAVNAQQLSTTDTFLVTVREVNAAPVLTLPANATINELTFYTNNATATDADLPPNPLTFALVSGPTGLSVSSAGAITWTPSEAQGPSTNTVTISVTDTNPIAVNATSLSVTSSFQIVVKEVNVAPALTLPANTTINELTFYTNNASATDADLPANPFTFALVSGPTGLSVSPTGAITWTPSEAQGPSTNTISVSVTDTNPIAVNATSLSVTSSFQIVVKEVNVAPVLTLPANTTISELTFYTNNATATDADLPANSLTFTLVSGPTGLSVSPAGAIIWTPSEAQGPSTNTVTVSVTDTNPIAVNATSLSVTSSFQIVVNEVNVAPMLTPPASRTIHAGTTFSGTATATDADVPTNSLLFALVSGPVGLTVNPAGAITWTTSDANANTIATVTLRVTDNGTPNLSNTNSFNITVVPRPQFTTITRSNGFVNLTWSSISANNYRLQFKTNLNDVSWNDLSGDVTAVSSTASKTDTVGPDPRRFYRVEVLP